MSKLVSDFKRDGYLVARNMYSVDEIAHVSTWIDELVAMPLETGKMMVYLEDDLKNPGKRILSRIEKFADSHKNLRKFIFSERMLSLCDELLGEESVLFKEKINFKLPGGGGFKPHQDIQPGWDEYAKYFISVLVTIDDSNEANGCLEMSAGHHTRGLLGEKWKPLTEEQLKGIEFTKYPMKPGDVAVFDCFAPHQSAPNLTDKPRRNMYLTFNRASDGDWRDKYYEDKRKSYPPDNERDPSKIYTFKV